MSDLITLHEPDGPLSDARSMTAAARTALLATRRLMTYTTSEDPAVSSTARHLLGTLMAEMGPAAARVPPSTAVEPPLVRLGVGLERQVTSSGRTQSRVPVAVEQWLARRWTLTGAVLSGLAAVLVVVGGYIGAVVLLTVRMVLSGIADLPPRPGSSAERHPHAVALWSVARCLAGHACDAALVLAVGYSFASADRPFWTWMSGAVLGLMLFGTVARLSTLQFGLPLRRLALERAARTGAMLVGLASAAVWTSLGWSPTSGTVPLLALPLLGTVAYALLELVRVRWRVLVLIAARYRKDPESTPLPERVVMVDVNGSVHAGRAVV